MDLQNKGQESLQSLDELMETEDMYTTVLYNDEVKEDCTSVRLVK